MNKKFLSILLTLVLAVSLLMVPAAVSANTTYTQPGGTIEVTSITPVTDLTKEAFDAEPETLVLDPAVTNAQTAGPVTIAGTVSALDLGAGWVDTAYVEIGVRPEATMNDRNAGVYLIAFNANVAGFTDGVETLIHLQDYTGSGNSPWATTTIAIPKDSAFRYEITLTPSGVGGEADLKVWVEGVLQSPEPTLAYGFASTWEEAVAGELDEDFTDARLFYSIIADRRGTAEITYSAAVNVPIGSGTVDMIATNPVPVIGIEVTPGSVSFGTVLPGVASDPQAVTVTNIGTVAEDFSATLANISEPDVYTTGLTIGDVGIPGVPVSDWEKLGVVVDSPDNAVDLELILKMPDPTPYGTYHATLIFWAEMAP